MKNYLISGLVDNYRIKTNLFAISPNQAIKVFQQKYPKAKDIQDQHRTSQLFRRVRMLSR